MHPQSRTGAPRVSPHPFAPNITPPSDALFIAAPQSCPALVAVRPSHLGARVETDPQTGRPPACVHSGDSCDPFDRVGTLCSKDAVHSIRYGLPAASDWLECAPPFHSRGEPQSAFSTRSHRYAHALPEGANSTVGLTNRYPRTRAYPHSNWDTTPYVWRWRTNCLAFRPFQRHLVRKC